MAMKCVDLFAGCGGLSLGFEKAGFNVAAAFEYWEPSIEIYKQNFTHPIFQQDLTNEKESIKKIKAYSPDLIMGGPPCQDFSSAGKRDVTQGRADLTIIATGATPDDEREFGVEGGGKRSRKFLAA